MGFFDDMASFHDDVHQVGERHDGVKQTLLTPVAELIDATEVPEVQDATDES